MATFRMAAGFLVAPVVPGLIIAASVELLGSRDPLSAWYVELSAALGYPTALVLGIPAYWLTKRYTLTSLAAYAAIGALLGIAAYFGVFLPGLLVAPTNPDVWHAMGGSLAFMPAACLSGVVAATAFWLIARPDLQVQS